MIIVTGLQGSGKRTFLSRAEMHGIPVFSMFSFNFITPVFKKTYEHILGPSRSRELVGHNWDEMSEFLGDTFLSVYKNNYMNESFKQAFSERFNITEPKIVNFPCPMATERVIDTYPEDDHTYVLVTAPEELHYERILAQEVPNDPRLRNKRNYEYLVRPQIETTIRSRLQFVESLRPKVDYVIHNDGELNQYYAAIDQVLDAENLLN